MQRQKKNSSYTQKPQQQSIVCIITSSSSLDTKEESGSVAPSYRAVSALGQANWVILTNGRLWRLYSSESVQPARIILKWYEGVSDETNHRLQYFVALFSASSLESNKNGLNELDSIYEEGLHHAKKIEVDI